MNELAFNITLSPRDVGISGISELPLIANGHWEQSPDETRKKLGHYAVVERDKQGNVLRTIFYVLDREGRINVSVTSRDPNEEITKLLGQRGLNKPMVGKIDWQTDLSTRQKLPVLKIWALDIPTGASIQSVRPVGPIVANQTR